MAIYRIDVRTDDAEAFSHWLRKHVPAAALVRSVGYGVRDGWHFKNVFSDRQVAEDFHRHWFPNAESHDVEVFGDSKP